MYVCVSLYMMNVYYFSFFCRPSSYAFLLFSLSCLWAKLPDLNKCMYVCMYSSALKIQTPLGSRTVFVVVPEMAADPT